MIGPREKNATKASDVLMSFNEESARTGRREQTAPHPLSKITDWGDIATLRGLRKAVFG
jgi:hypothetical protein